MSIDNAFGWRCSIVKFAKVLDQFNGIGCYSGTAVGMHLQKFWISFAKSSVMTTSERHLGGQTASSWPWNGVWSSPVAPNWPCDDALGHPAASNWPWNSVWAAT